MRFHYVDVGAANNTRELPWNKFKENLEFTLFEPDPLAAQKLRESSKDFKTNVRESALGSTHRKSTLNICKKRELSSFLEPNQGLLSRFPDQSRWDVVEKIDMEITKLDSHLSLIGAIDFLKIDTQGSELDILEGAEQALTDVLAIQVEVEFLPLYIGQPLFGDVSNFLLKKGFELWDFTTIYRYGREKLDRSGQVAFADALFFKPPERILQNNDAQTTFRKLRKLEVVSEVFGMQDIKKICQNFTL